MKRLHTLLVAATALCCVALPLPLQAAQTGQWSHAGFTQWHPQDGKTPLAVGGTQCYFCKPDPTAEVAAPAPVPAPPAPAPVVQEDRCTDTPKGAPVDKRGCWVLKNLTFRFNSAKIQAKDSGTIKDTASVLKQNPDLKVEIQGHTDNIGKPAYNKKLSQRRANAVMKGLVKQGVNKKRLTAKGYGMEKPVASNATKEGRAENRRVELRIIK
ncbi:OmpA family protein [Candidatus Magnetaquicoccus inordinatus]|uniref:OmpA family protein n=1 Tax=Candidatus Magnetaquicoccus inordinatus TaxID=2496818 RepID=UPI00187D1613|nr:OmpA family protein [Candidatus Magnetaquicoccus inordinatus]